MNQTNVAVSELNLKLLKRAPFLATVALHAEVKVEERPGVGIAATDGRRIFLSPSQFMPKPTYEKLFIYAHEVLHCAFSHPTRRGERDPRVWNIAADIVVNGLLVQSGLEAPDWVLRDETLEMLSSEGVYEQLLSKGDIVTLEPDRSDLLSPTATGLDTSSLKTYWQGVLRRAATAVKMTGAGKLPLGAELEVVLGKQQVDWRSALLRFLSCAQDDYGAFDTRLIHRGLYVKTLESQSLDVAVHIDTSGSLNCAEAQGQFLSELKGILTSYPGVRVNLTYGDTELYGPFDLTQDTHIPPPQGGGGTSFVPFFEQAEDTQTPIPRVVFTDGYGCFPSGCDAPCLWVVTEGGLPSDRFPFGEVTRLAS